MAFIALKEHVSLAGCLICFTHSQWLAMEVEFSVGFSVLVIPPDY